MLLANISSHFQFFPLPSPKSRMPQICANWDPSYLSRSEGSWYIHQGRRNEAYIPKDPAILVVWVGGSILSSRALWLTLLIAKKKKWERALKFSVRGSRPKCTENHLGFIFHQWGFRQQIQHISFQTQVSILSFSHPNTHGSNNEPYINPVNFTVEIIRKWHPNLCQ